MIRVSQGPGQIVTSSADPIEKQRWHIVIVGRLSVMTRDAGGFCPVWFFESGQTFARSYLNLFAASAGPTELLSHIETLSSVKYLEVHVPERLAPEERIPLTNSRYSRYFRYTCPSVLLQSSRCGPARSGTRSWRSTFTWASTRRRRLWVSVRCAILC